MSPTTNASPRVFRPKFVGRMVGAGYLLMLASGFDLFYVLAKLYVPGDAAATAANIKAHEALFLAGFAGALIGVASSLVVTALFYRLYEPVNRTLSGVGSRFRIFRINDLEMVDQISTSSNPLLRWLRQIDALRTAA